MSPGALNRFSVNLSPTPRTTEHGRGVALYIKYAFTCDTIADISVAIDDFIESIFVKVKIQKKTKTYCGLPL